MITVVGKDGRRRRFFRSENKQSPNYKKWICRECGHKFEDMGLKSIRPALVAHVCIKNLQ